MDEVILGTLDDTQRVAEFLARSAKRDDIFLLFGDLGAGKTTFSRFFIQSYLQTNDLVVTSPTFTLIQTYGPRSKEVWHVDLYRLESSKEIHNLGLEEAYGRALLLIEWPERFGPYRPCPAREIHLSERQGVRTIRF